MNETTSPQPESDPEKNGLRSISGIRWLLLAGSTVTGVSIFRLVQARWDAIPVPLQFLMLVAGALAIFALGNVTRRRLRLPAAGSALLFLFTGLVPVMAWGAVYLKLLDTPGGWLAFGAGMAALLGAAVSVLRTVLRYPGTLYPAALGILLAAQAVLPWLGSRWPWSPASLYGLAAVILGAVLHLGSRHINRFFFHRDRLDSVDRPVHLVPFLLLGVLYAGALSLLDLRSAFLALPLAVLGWILAGTGEEYYQALTASLGEAPVSWPRAVRGAARPRLLLRGGRPAPGADGRDAALPVLHRPLRRGALPALEPAIWAPRRPRPGHGGGVRRVPLRAGPLGRQPGIHHLERPRLPRAPGRLRHPARPPAGPGGASRDARRPDRPGDPADHCGRDAPGRAPCRGGPDRPDSLRPPWLIARQSRPGGRIDSAFLRSSQGLAIIHAGFAVALFTHAVAVATVTVEPLILLLLGLVLLWEGLTGREEGLDPRPRPGGRLGSGPALLLEPDAVRGARR